jgi:hypothetical protein
MNEIPEPAVQVQRQEISDLGRVSLRFRNARVGTPAMRLQMNQNSVTARRDNVIWSFPTGRLKLGLRKAGQGPENR